MFSDGDVLSATDKFLRSIEAEFGYPSSYAVYGPTGGGAPYHQDYFKTRLDESLYVLVGWWVTLSIALCGSAQLLERLCAGPQVLGACSGHSRGHVWVVGEGPGPRWGARRTTW